MIIRSCGESFNPRLISNGFDAMFFFQELNIFGRETTEDLHPSVVECLEPSSIYTLEGIEEENKFLEVFFGEFSIDGIGGVGKGMRDIFAYEVISQFIDIGS